MGNFVFNPLVGQLYALFTGDSKKKSAEERSKILGFEWCADDSSDCFFIGPNGISSDFPDTNIVVDTIQVPVYARRELLRLYVTYKGRKPRVPGIEFGVTDAMSLIEYYYRTLRGDDLTDFMLFGTTSVSKNKVSFEILNNGFLAESSSRPKNAFLNQQLPLDADGRHFSVDSLILHQKNGEDLRGPVVSRHPDRVTVALSGDQVTDVSANEIRIVRSKNRRTSQHSLIVGEPRSKSLYVRTTFGFFIQVNRQEVYKKAEDGGVRIVNGDGYSVDAAMKSSMKHPMYQLYAPDGDSLGIISSHSSTSLDDIADAHLASTLFTDW